MVNKDYQKSCKTFKHVEHILKAGRDCVKKALQISFILHVSLTMVYHQHAFKSQKCFVKFANKFATFYCAVSTCKT